MARTTVANRWARWVSRSALALLVAGTTPSVATSRPVPSASLSEPHWVSFESARVEPSAFSRRLAGAVSVHRPDPLRGLLVGPLGAGKFPAVVLVHGCRGLQPSHRGWAHWLASHGFVALLVDSFFTRHASGVCSLGPDAAARQERNGRVFDAFGALQYLRRHPRVDPARVAIMGWNSWAPLTAVARSGPRALFSNGFRAAIAVTPDCPLDADIPQQPALIVAAGAEPGSHAARCRRLAERLGAALSVSVLSGATRGFDDAQAADGALDGAEFHLRTASAAQRWARYDARAHRDAATQVLAFLAPALQPSGRAKPSREAAKATGARPHWVVRPGTPGPDIAPVGRSLFERVFTQADGQVRVPFPFSQLLERLALEVGAGPGRRDGVAVSLIPLGRSLQRDAAAPDFFRFPRIVVAVDGEPHDVPRARLLKDRLFLGYQEKSGIIEVISYNEMAGRFEFQVVEDYLPHGKPTLRHANRVLCMSCHQNGAPIFARAAWDETNNNLDVARRLRASRADFHGLPALRGDAAAARVDNATDRANLLATWQLLWRAGCGANATQASACRGAALLAMIQHRLSGSSGHDRDSATYRVDFLDAMRREWSRRFSAALDARAADAPLHHAA